MFMIGSFSTRPIWWHYVTIVVPKTFRRPKTAFLLIDGGSNSDLYVSVVSLLMKKQSFQKTNPFLIFYSRTYSISQDSPHISQNIMTYCVILYVCYVYLDHLLVVEQQQWPVLLVVSLLLFDRFPIKIFDFQYVSSLSFDSIGRFILFSE